MAIARQGRFLFSAGGLLAPSWYQEDLLAEVVEQSDTEEEAVASMAEAAEVSTVAA